VTLETVSAGTGNVAITASGSIVDLDTTAAVDITAAGLILVAGASVGSASNALDTAVSTIAAKTAADGIYLNELDSVSVNTVSVAVQRVNSQAGLSVQTVELSDLTTTGGNGNIELISQAGSITLNDGAPVNGAAVSANGSGSVLIKALGAGSDITISANIVSTSGPVTIFATDIVTLSSVILTTGVVSIDTSASGKVVFSKPVSQTEGNQDINVVANTIDITTPLASAGGGLLVTTLTSPTPTPIVVGGADPGGVLHLGLDEVNRVQKGFADVTLGNAQANQSIQFIGRENDGTTASPVVFKDPLIINAAGAANSVAVSGGLTGTTLTVLGSLTNTTTTLTAANVSMVGDVTLNGLIEVATGATVITAGNTAADGVIGSLAISGNIRGVGGVNETLELRSERDVLVTGTISGIDALTVTAANNVTFNDTVAVTGNLVVNATGAVKFDKSLTLSEGGTLMIQGASSVEFASGAIVKVDGNLTINAQTLALLGGADSLQSTVPNSTLTITSASTSNNIMIGSTVGQELAGALNMTVRDIQAIGNNFTNVVIGEAGLGVITVAGNTDLTSVTGSSIDILGNTITLQAGNVGGAVQVPGAVRLAASGNIVLNSGISTGTTSQVSVVSSGGSITMAQGTGLNSLGGNIELAGNGLTLGYINRNSAVGIVKIDAGSSTVTDANRNSAPDIFAKAINFTGYGPATGTAGDVLEVVADVVQISVPKGLVVRDTGADGRTYFNVMDGGKLYQQLVVEGTNVTRVTEDPAALQNKTNAELIAAGLPTNSSWLNQSVLTQSTAAFFSLAPQLTSSTAVSRYLAPASTGAVLQGDIVLSGMTVSGFDSDDLLSDTSYGLANRLQQAYILGTPGEQPLVSGLDTFSQDTFEYWVDTLSL
jgi:hypothetical protein